MTRVQRSGRKRLYVEAAIRRRQSFTTRNALLKGSRHTFGEGRECTRLRKSTAPLSKRQNRRRCVTGKTQSPRRNGEVGYGRPPKEHQFKPDFKSIVESGLVPRIRRCRSAGSDGARLHRLNESPSPTRAFRTRSSPRPKAPGRSRSTTGHRLASRAIPQTGSPAFEPAKATGFFGVLPFGSDLTEEEQRLFPALNWLRSASASKLSLVHAVLKGPIAIERLLRRLGLHRPSNPQGAFFQCKNHG